MKEWVKFVICTAIFFFAFLIVDLILGGSVDWLALIITTIVFAGLMFLFNLYQKESKKSKKSRKLEQALKKENTAAQEEQNKESDE